MSGIFIKAGAWVTCENGHRICRAARDILSGEMLTAAQFEEWTIPTPEPHQTVAPHDCGAPYIRVRGIGAVVAHLEEGGWTGAVKAPDVDILPLTEWPNQ